MTAKILGPWQLFCSFGLVLSELVTWDTYSDRESLLHFSTLYLHTFSKTVIQSIKARRSTRHLLKFSNGIPCVTDKGEFFGTPL